jgi:hypothetical protein
MIRPDGACVHGPAGRAELLKDLSVHYLEDLVVRCKVAVVSDRFDGAHRLTGTTINTFVRVDVKHPIALVNAIDRAIVDARLVLNIHAGWTDHIAHLVPMPLS